MTAVPIQSTIASGLVIGSRLLRRPATAHWRKPLAVGLTALAGALAVFLLWTLVTDPQYTTMLGNDRAIYVSAVGRWESGGGFYLASQLSGPYEVLTGDVMYPPFALPAFAVLALLPSVLYWAVPLGIIAAVIVYHRPKSWAWPLIAACIAYPWTLMLVVAGNPAIWVAAAVALGTVWGWPAILVALKPSLLPFALLGIRHRSWWVAGAGLAIVALVFGSLWFEWIHVVLNARGWRSGLLYSLSDAPLLAIPAVAWIGGSRHRIGERAPATSRSRHVGIAHRAAMPKSLERVLARR